MVVGEGGGGGGGWGKGGEIYKKKSIFKYIVC